MKPGVKISLRSLMENEVRLTPWQERSAAIKPIPSNPYYTHATKSAVNIQQATFFLFNRAGDEAGLLPTVKKRGAVATTQAQRVTCNYRHRVCEASTGSRRCCVSLKKKRKNFFYNESDPGWMDGWMDGRIRIITD